MQPLKMPASIYQARMKDVVASQDAMRLLVKQLETAGPQDAEQLIRDGPNIVTTAQAAITSWMLSDSYFGAELYCPRATRRKTIRAAESWHVECRVHGHVSLVCLQLSCDVRIRFRFVFIVFF